MTAIVDDRDRALPLHQPWGTLTVRGIKKRETRSTPPPSTILGRRVAIHACKTTRAVRLLCSSWPFNAIDLEPATLPFGAIVGSLLVVGWEEITPASASDLLARDPREYALGDYTPGRFAWLLAEPRELQEPIPFTPRSQGIFFVPPDLAEQINDDNNLRKVHDVR